MSDNDKAILDKRVSKHTAFTIDTKELSDYLKKSGGAGQFRLRIDRDMDWTIDLELNDLRTPDFRIEYITPEGTFECKEPFVVNTYHGRTSTGLPVAFTIDENTFFGIIFSENYYYTIRPAMDFTQNRADRSFIVYHSWNIIPDEKYSHFIHDAIQATEDKKELMEQSRNTTCDYVLRIATVADADFYDIHKAKTSSEIISTINAVSAIYKAQITNLKLMICNQFIYTVNPPQYYSSDITTLMNDFRNYWKSNHTNIERNVAHLFTGKTLTYLNYISNFLGISWGPDAPFFGQFGIGNNLGYSISMNHASSTAIIAHEIGHNLTATHPDSTCNCYCNNNKTATIMCPLLTSSKNLWFCQ